MPGTAYTLETATNAWRKEHYTNAETMRRELRALARFLAEIDTDDAMNDCSPEELARHMQYVKVEAQRMDRTLAQYTASRAALGALAAIDRLATRDELRR